MQDKTRQRRKPEIRISKTEHTRLSALADSIAERNPDLSDELLAELDPGDAVWFAPGELHWHGAGEADAFVYVSVQAVQDGRAVQWHEPV